MKATIEVKDKREAEVTRSGLEDPAVKAFVIIVGALAPLTPRARERILQYVTDKFDEDQAKPAPGSLPPPPQGNGGPT